MNRHLVWGWKGLEGAAIDRALGAMGDFADLLSPYLVGHSAGVAALAAAAADRAGLAASDVISVQRAGLVHDLGRVAVPARVWRQSAPLTPDDWEQIRLHAYYTERVLSPSPFLSRLAPIASFHHERLDGSGYHRGVAAPGLTRAARVLAADDGDGRFSLSVHHGVAGPVGVLLLHGEPEGGSPGRPGGVGGNAAVTLAGSGVGL